MLRRHFFPINTNIANANQRTRHMCQRRQVAGRADGTLGWNARIYFGLQERAETVHQFQSRTRITLGERGYLHDHRQADNRVGQQGTDPNRVRQHEIHLQFG